MSIGVYPGSFDPVTNGHLDIVTRASHLFDKIVVAVYDTPSKRLLFSTEERVELFREAVKHLPNVDISRYTGLTVDFARQCKAQALVRGLRMGGDFESEFTLGLMNKQLAPDIESVYLMSSIQYQFLSSTLLKEAAQLGGDIDSMVPRHVAAALREKYQVAGVK